MKRRRTIRPKDARRRGQGVSTIVDALTDAEIQAAVRKRPAAVPLDFDWSKTAPAKRPKKTSARKRKKRG